MNDQSPELARVALLLRISLESLGKISATLLDMKRFELSSEAFNVELELAKLHLKIMKAAGKPGKATPVEDSPDCRQEDFPF